MVKTSPFRFASRGSFKRQIILTFMGGFLLLTAVFAAYMVQTEKDYLYRDSDNEATSLTESLAASSASWVLANDVVGLQEVIHSFQTYHETLYTMVISPSGQVLAHSDAANIGKFVSDPQSLALLKAPPEKRIMADDASVIEIAVPIVVNDRLVAWARVAHGRQDIAGNLRQLLFSGALFVLVAAILALFAATLIAHRLGARIGSLVKVAEEVQAGNFAMRAKISGADEVSILGNSLNLMLDALARNEQRVIQRTAELEAANKELEAFAYSVSHDLRAPLRSIDGFSLALLDDYADKVDAEGKDYLKRIRAASQRMAQLIDDILNLSRITRGELVREEVDLSALAHTVAAELQHSQPDRKVELVIRDGMVADGDHRLLQLVLENLIGNAWKYTSRAAAPRIEFGQADVDGKPTYFVRDNGAGFDMEYVTKLFLPFQRLHAPEEFPGIGIGLALVQRIIRRHGGTIWAEGAVERGATFYFRLA